MAHPPFPGEFESLARQYWNTWNEALGRGVSFDGWNPMAALAPGRADPAAFDWFSRIQQLAARFGDGAGGASAAEIAGAWREMLGYPGGGSFADVLRAMHGGLAGDDWLERVRPLLEMLLRPLRQQQAEWLQRPAFGPAREHQERLQALALAWQEWEERNEAFAALLAQAGQQAFERFEGLLQERDAPGKRLESARALFDLWIDAAEEAWAQVAMSDEYRHAYADMTNAMMRVRLGLQREVESFGALLGLPGRGELDALHRKVAGLERELHAARKAGPVRAAAADRRAAEKEARLRTPPRAGDRAAAVPPKPATKAAAARPATAEAMPIAAPRKPARRTSAKANATPAGKPAPAKTSARTAQSRAAEPRARKARATPASSPGKPGSGIRPEAKKAAARSPASGTPSRRPAAAAPAKRGAAVPPAPAGRRPVSDTPASRTRRASAAKAVSGRPAASPRASTRATGPSPARTASMKDWVGRNLAAAADAAGRRGGRG